MLFAWTAAFAILAVVIIATALIGMRLAIVQIAANAHAGYGMRYWP